MKRFTLLLAILAATMSLHAVTMAQMRFHCAEDTIKINSLLKAGYDSGLTDANRLVAFYARQLLGTPYVGHTLEGDSEQLTINIDQLDCTTFVETLYALTRTTLEGRYTWRDYARHLENLRYRGGTMGDYSSRLHYISDWIVDNRSRGNLIEVTPDVPHSKYTVKTINYMSTHADSYRSLKNDSAMVAKIKGFENAYRNHRMPLLPKSWLKHKDVEASLREGDFVGLMTTTAGLDISHLGIIVKDDQGHIHLLDASMSGGKVMEEAPTLYQQLSSNKSNTGIRVFRIK